MSIKNLDALEEKNAADGNGIGSVATGYGDADESPYMNAVDPTPRSASSTDDSIAGPSGLELLRTRTRERVSKTSVIAVPGRDGIAIEVDAFIESVQMREWTKLSRLVKNRPANDDNIDGVRLASRGLAAKTTGILIDDKRLVDEDTGDALTFLDDAVKAMYGVRTPWDAAEALVGSDPGILNMFQTLMEEAGYANTAEVLSGGK